MRVAVPNTCPSLESARVISIRRLYVVAGPDGFLDAALGLFLLPGDALGIDPQQDIHAVARPVGDLRYGYSGIEPGGLPRGGDRKGAWLAVMRTRPGGRRRRGLCGRSRGRPGH